MSGQWLPVIPVAPLKLWVKYDTLLRFFPVLHMCRYEVELQNRGKIDVQFALMQPETTFGKKFRFEPDTGLLHGGEIQVLPVQQP